MTASRTPDPDTAEAAAAIEAAIGHHRAGRLNEAERLYLAALAHDPRSWRASHNLALIHLDRKEPARALPLLEVAMETEPAGAETWLAYVRALINAGRFEAAQRIIADHAADPRARALEVRLHQVRGMRAMQSGDFGAAEAAFRRVLALTPDDPQAIGDLGYALLAQEDLAGAEEVLQHAVSLAPENLPIRLNLGSALYKLGRPAEAEPHYRRALALDPGNAATLRNLGLLLIEAGRPEEALQLATQAAPGAEAAAAHIRSEALISLARYEEALSALDELVGLDPGDARAICRRSAVRLLLCDYEAGWRDYEARWRLASFLEDSTIACTPPINTYFDANVTAHDLRGRSVLLVGEQGIGDQVMFAGAVPDLIRDAGRVTLVCEDRLVGLFASSFPDVEILPMKGLAVAVGAYERVVPLGSLGRIYRSRPEEFPRRPYLHVRDEVRAGWAAKLGPKPAGLRIGVSWRGGTAKTGAVRRSVTLEQLAPVLELPGCEFVSLQYGEVADEIARFNAGRERPIRVFPRADIDDFEALAGLIEGLDVVVSVQTSVVHLAGGLGKACLALIPFSPEWRYTARGEAMPWYASVRLFRQAEPGAWDDVITRAADDLRRRIG